MAKKVAHRMHKRHPNRKAKIVEAKISEASGREHYSQLIRELISNPAVKYIAGGIAASILSRLAINMSEKYPELSSFLRENIDSFEGKLGQFRPGVSGDRESRA